MEQQIKTILAELDNIFSRLKIDEQQKRAEILAKEMEQPNFWHNRSRAAEIAKEISNITNRIDPWLQLEKEATDISALIGLKDDSLGGELQKQVNDLQNHLDIMKKDLVLSGPYDDHDAILSIYAGAGGTDAQDWAQMLSRMYIRWAAAQTMKINTIQESSGDEAGIKSLTMEILGDYAYGKLKGEHGVHRLVRLSPFNADNLRQTSFAKVEVLPKIERPDEVELDEKDLKIDVYRSGGHGGQSVNTTDSAVRITHLPTGINVAIQNERSQLQNKEAALTILRSRLAQLQMEQHLSTIAAVKGPNQSAEWGNQIRSYVMHPYTMVKDLRSKCETSDVQSVLDGKIDLFIDAFLNMSEQDLEAKN